MGVTSLLMKKYSCYLSSAYFITSGEIWVTSFGETHSDYLSLVKLFDNSDWWVTSNLISRSWVRFPSLLHQFRTFSGGIQSPYCKLWRLDFGREGFQKRGMAA